MSSLDADKPSLAVADYPVVESRLPTILTIDDDPYVCQALKRSLSKYRVEVVQACYGMHGIFLAKTKTPDVIVTDLRMPQGQGHNVVEWLRSQPKTQHVPIVVLTGLHDDQLRERMWTLGINAYLTKPIAFEELCETLRQFIRLEKVAEDE